MTASWLCRLYEDACCPVSNSYPRESTFGDAELVGFPRGSGPLNKPARHCGPLGSGLDIERGLEMTKEQKSEPPSWLRPPLFMVGRDRRGNWVVQEQKGMRGGLFVDREAALRYVRSENRFRAQAVVMVSGDFELDVNHDVAAVRRVESASDLSSRRRIA